VGWRQDQPTGDPGMSVRELPRIRLAVAELVAEGRSNRDVADALFITVRTVEANLTRIYRMLDVHSRTELAARWDQLAGY
jgi:DNA-binding NarL/FixJ family response regulator